MLFASLCRFRLEMKEWVEISPLRNASLYISESRPVLTLGRTDFIIDFFRQHEEKKLRGVGSNCKLCVEIDHLLFNKNNSGR